VTVELSSRFTIQGGDAIFHRRSYKIKLVVVTNAVVVKLAIQFGRELGIGHDGTGNCDQVAHALHVRQFANSLGRIQLLLVEVDGAGEGHDAVLSSLLYVPKFLFFCELLRHSALNDSVIPTGAGLSHNPDAKEDQHQNRSHRTEKSFHISSFSPPTY